LAISNVSVSLNEDATIASLLWDAGVLAKEYSVFRNHNLLTTTGDLSIIDNKYKVHDCYEISYTDNCGNISAETEACPIVLDYTLRDDNTVDLQWTAYMGWENGITRTYELLIYDISGNVTGTVSGSNTSYHDVQNDDQVVIYRVTGKGNNPAVPDVLSNVVTVIKNPHIYYPTAFSPDSHNAINKTFQVFGKYIESIEMQIFNRWGEMIFSTKEKNEGWDGTHLGVPVPAGVYAFIAKITDSAGEKITKSGTVALIRKK
jgi:gliding motility-associated-like protein